MLHAVIRTDRDTFHFFGEVSGYNLETLQQHVQQARRDAGAVRLHLKIDAADRALFERSTSHWLSQLAHTGTIVEVNTRGHRDQSGAPLA